MNAIDTLRRNKGLYRLLEHYVELGRPDREVWQQRVESLDGRDATEMSKRHGQLIAFGWIELNSVFTSATEAGSITRCYRVTSSGVRALRMANRPSDQEESLADAA